MAKQGALGDAEHASKRIVEDAEKARLEIELHLTDAQVLPTLAIHLASVGHPVAGGVQKSHI
jgi:hypothetical protein